ncbi:hypothetical protein JR316_0012598 [Psilocybe cubensis]|uniref:Uncharacterized protein n=2 Tax=Psilocybe cubensis TaxID=181762 RepID=A0A8H7XNI3_PSICU|nr:hypothetical protein JR316_0012598 [Psilocybe cubensis]KAH9475487.1 hypothetical protein JR316_0012598 [Psilocybe cubensis]
MEYFRQYLIYRRKDLPPAELERIRAQHREAQARYREKNRLNINLRSRRYYRTKKQKEMGFEEPDEEAEWIRLSALAHEITEEEWIRLHGTNSYRGGSKRR